MRLQRLAKVLSSRGGWLTLSIQLTIVLYWFGDAQISESTNFPAEVVYTGSYIAGRWVEVGSPLSIWIVLSNLIPILTGQGVIKIIYFLLPFLSVNALSWIHGTQLVMMSVFQAALFGSFVEKMIGLIKTHFENG